VVNPAGALKEAGRLLAEKPGKSPVAGDAHFGTPVKEPFDATPPGQSRIIAFSGLGTSGVLLLTCLLMLGRRARAKLASHNVDTEVGMADPVEYPRIS
jgi:hypothetical protein